MNTSIKAFSLFFVFISVIGISFALFQKNASGKMGSVFQIGSTSSEVLAALSLPIALIFLYHSFR